MKCPKCQYTWNEPKNKFTLKNIPLKEAFEVAWECYPNKDGKKVAWGRWRASIRNTDDITRFHRALNNYLAHLKVETWKRPKSGSTFFNNWEDWVNWKDGANIKPKEPQINQAQRIDVKEFYRKKEAYERQRENG